MVNLSKRFQLKRDEDDEEGQEVVHALHTVVRKSSAFKVSFLRHNMLCRPNRYVKHDAFSDSATVLTHISKLKY